MHPVDQTMISIAPSGHQTTARLAGETDFTMKCMVTLPCDTEPVVQPTFNWLFHRNNNEDTSLMTSSHLTRKNNTYTSTIRFSSLSQSDAGTYTCQLGGNPRLAASYDINGDY